MSDNRLAVLVVHDTPFLSETEDEILHTADLALCKVGQRRYISGWQTVLKILAHAQEIEPPPDLLLIDARFEKDESAPDLGRLRIRISGDETADPRGLLYGAVLASQFAGPNRLPFGFEVYSADLPSIAEDPYAQTFYGLLKGLTRSVAANPGRGRVFAEDMRATPTGALPRDSWGIALRRFRSSLQETLGQGWAPDYISFSAARDALNALLERGVVPPEDLTVRWRQGDGKLRNVLLRSLFADCRQQWSDEWDTQALERLTIVKWLDELGKRGDFLRDVEHQVTGLINGWYTFPEAAWEPDFRNPAHAAGSPEAVRWVRAMSFIVLRALNLRDRARDENVRVLDALQLARQLPLADLQETALERTLAGALTYVLFGQAGREVSPAQVLAALGPKDRWPVAWSADAQSLVTKLLGRVTDNRKNWPQWALVDD
ncbi:MAG: hypothetical protein JWP08_1720 [Bryobacterales bacterium]|nr:hypothetical protein [Bryobacterales bacterium]